MKPAFTDRKSLFEFLCRGNGHPVQAAVHEDGDYVHWRSTGTSRYGTTANMCLGTTSEGEPFAERLEGRLDMVIHRRDEFDFSVVAAEFQAAATTRRMRGVPEPDTNGNAVPPEVAAVIDAFCDAVDVEALTLLAHLPTWKPELYSWLTEGPQRAFRIGLAAAYPWATPIFKHAHDFGLLDEDGAPEAVLMDACVRILESLGRKPSVGTLRALLRTTRGSSLGRACVPGPARGLSNLNDLPVHWIPKASADRGIAEMAARNLDALLMTLPPLADFAAATGATVGEKFGPEGETWSAAVRRLLVRGGAAEEDAAEAPLDSIVDCTSTMLVDHANDFVFACASHLIKPAVALVRPDLAETKSSRPLDDERLGGVRWEFFDPRNAHHAYVKAALRLLARDKTLPGFVEEIRNWHVGITPINNAIARLCHDVRWKPAFPDFESPDGTVVHCVSSAAELLEEAVAMDNCAASYLDDCASGEAIVASVRNRRGRRIGTVEFVPYVRGRPGIATRPIGLLDIAQAVGHGNSEAPRAVVKAATALAKAVEEGRLKASLPPEEIRRRGQPGVIQRALTAVGGSPELFGIMMDAWKPFLARDLRGGSAADLVAACGIDLTALEDGDGQQRPAA